MADEELRVLEKYLADAKSLDDLFDCSELTRIHWLIKKAHLFDCLQESSPRVHVALQLGQMMLLHWSAFTSEQRAHFERLQQEDVPAYRSWKQDYLRRNLHWAAKSVLGLYDGIEMPRLPPPDGATITLPSQID